MSKFIHLHTHSHYSLLDGMGKIPDLVLRAKELGMSSLALTDHGTVYGLIEFYETCKKEGIKPILGVEAYVARRGLKDKDAGIDAKSYHLVLLAKNQEGYKNILQLTSIAHLDGFYYKPRIDKETLKKYSGGLIGLSACLAGEVARSVLSDNLQTAKSALEEYKEIFGEGNFYLELQPHTSTKNNDQEKVNKGLIELARQTNTPLVCTKDVHYINKDDKEVQDALLCIQTGTTVDSTKRMSMMDIDCHFAAEDEMRAAFPDLPDIVENTSKIAEMCNVELDLGKDILPTFKTPEGVSDVVYLRQLCEEGLKKRYKEITPEIKERLEFELSTIERMGYSSYFLIVQDFVDFAKREGIIVGPGRGSAAGCIIAYALGVTDLDPIHYKLLFERFLNPDRISMPDIDLDFADTKRGKVIEYVTDKYGKDKVAGIITFGTMMARAVVRDVGRVLGVPYSEVDTIAKLIPPPQQGRHVPLSQHIKENPELNRVYNSSPQIKHLMDFSIRLEGTVRHASQHACGVVISDKPLSGYTALQKAQGGDVETVTQYSLHPIESVGLLKIDFLGLSNLSIIQDTLEIVEAVHGEKVDINNIPLDDKETFGLFSRGETTGVFQLESAGMKRYIKELKPTKIEDIIAMVALYRPGPMQFIDSFIKRKNGREKIEYMHPKMEKALENTYGIPVYQEQVMQISKDLAGFTGGEADTLRKAMGKKIAKLMTAMKTKFVEGAVANGVESK
ncbi:MAG: DNA polymerase III subunit alpha, partial [Parcubacteria group bacterium]|nr:DNA polymerase III subunit alpha [Parcubacteria group bacterium]